MVAVCDTPFNVAVIVTAVLLLLTAPAVAVKVPEVPPDGMVTELGTVNSVLLVPSVIEAP